MHSLHDIFHCADQSAMLHNYVTSENPAPGAWSRHSSPQSPLGRVAFPEVLSVERGELYTRAGDGQVIEHMLLKHDWLPWHFTGRGAQFEVERTVGHDVFVAKLGLKEDACALLLLECRRAAGLQIDLERDTNRVLWRWRDFEVELAFDGHHLELLFSDDPGPLKRRFAGFDDVQLQEKQAHWSWQHAGYFWLGAMFHGEIQVTFSVRRGQTERQEYSFGDVAKSEERRWQQFFEDLVPPLPQSAWDNPMLRDTYYFAWQMLWSNLCEGGTKRLPHPFISPARLHYGSQWWWDSAFHAAALRHLKDDSLCYQELQNLWSAQHPDGGVPGCLRFALAEEEAGDESLGFVTMQTQPPVIGFILQLMHEQPGWPADLPVLYERLLRYAQWNYSSERDSDGDGLTEFRHCFETGTDQSPRWDAHKLDPTKTIDTLRPVEAIDLNVWMSELWRTLAMMARDVGDTSAAIKHEEQARAIFEQVEQLMWNEKAGMYFDIDAATHEQVRVKTVAGFMPLLSPYIRRDRASRLVHEHLLKPNEFWCEYPVPSVALDESTFDPVNMWRGPTWVNTDWMIAEGLRRQGFETEARQLARKTVELVGPRYEAGRRVRSPRLWEWFHPFTGEPLGNPQYSWSALVIDLILRFSED